MVYHYMIHDLIRSNADLQACWDRMPKISADLPHAVAHRGMLQPLDEEMKRFIESGQAPLFKLTWKLDVDTVPPGSVLDYLFSLNSVSEPQHEVVAL
jgi:hypothetical protein